MPVDHFCRLFDRLWHFAGHWPCLQAQSCPRFHQFAAQLDHWPVQRASQRAGRRLHTPVRRQGGRRTGLPAGIRVGKPRHRPHPPRRRAAVQRRGGSVVGPWGTKCPGPGRTCSPTCMACPTGCALKMGLNGKGNIVTRRSHVGSALIRRKRYSKGYLDNEAYDSPDAGQAGWIQG
jgi:hypothetical protein